MGSKRGVRRRHMPGTLATYNELQAIKKEHEANRRELRRLRAEVDAQKKTTRIQDQQIKEKDEEIEDLTCEIAGENV